MGSAVGFNPLISMAFHVDSDHHKINQKPLEGFRYFPHSVQGFLFLLEAFVICLHLFLFLCLSLPMAFQGSRRQNVVGATTESITLTD